MTPPFLPDPMESNSERFSTDGWEEVGEPERGLPHEVASVVASTFLDDTVASTEHIIIPSELARSSAQNDAADSAVVFVTHVRTDGRMTDFLGDILLDEDPLSFFVTLFQIGANHYCLYAPVSFVP